MIFGVSLLQFLLASVGQDLANQIRWSTQYKTEIKTQGVSPGKYLAAEVGEYFSGRQDVASDSIGLHWISGSISFASFFTSVNRCDCQAYQLDGPSLRVTAWMLPHSTACFPMQGRRRSALTCLYVGYCSFYPCHSRGLSCADQPNLRRTKAR